MHNTVPVPSKSALRALRNLALGTSFTVAFSTAVLTEDRRRRIQCAREVRANAKKLKNSSNYNSASSLSAIDTIQERLSRHPDALIWAPLRTVEADTSSPVPDKPLQSLSSSSAIHSGGNVVRHRVPSLQHQPVADDYPSLRDFYHTINQLLKCEALNEEDSVAKRNGLKEAACLFVAKCEELRETPTTMIRLVRGTFLALAERLCRQLCWWGMADISLQVYECLNRGRAGKAPIAGHCFVEANHNLGSHMAVIEYFENIYEPLQGQTLFYTVGTTVLKSGFAVGLDTDAMANILVEACNKAKEHKLVISTSWLLEVMGCEWRANHDIARIRALFERMKPYFSFMSHPQAVYSLVIQCCVEAGEEESATLYSAEFKRSCPENMDDIAILGHFALANALRNDWTAVKDDFRNMRSIMPDRAALNRYIVPVLKIYARSHSVAATESFLSDFVDCHGLPLTNFIQNLMIDAYGRAKEVEPLSRWIYYTASVGCPFDAVSFRTILNNADKVWGFSFDQTLELYDLILRFERGISGLVDEETVALLQRIAVNQARGNSQQALKNLARVDKGLGKTPTKPTSRSVQRSMSLALKLGQPLQVLELYKDAQTNGVPLHHNHITLAVSASLRLHRGGVDETAYLIQEAQQKGLQTGPALALVLTSQISKFEVNSIHEAERIMKHVSNTISVLEKDGIEIAVSVVTQTASLLEREGYPRQAIEFWRTMSHRPGFAPSTPDLATLTVLLRAYTAMQSSDGVKWAMGILETNKLVADKKFKLVLRKASKGAKRLMDKARLPHHLLEFYKTVTQAHDQVIRSRQEASKEREIFKYKIIEAIDQTLSQRMAGKVQVATTFLDHHRTEIGLDDSTVEFNGSYEGKLSVL